MAELIDREELRERIYSRFGRHSTKVIATVEEGREMADWAFLEPFLNAAKTVDAEPIRRGRWIFGESNGHGWMKCDQCLKSQDYQTGVFSYCPNCGARMDGDENGRTD